MTPDRAEAERFLKGLDPNASGWTFQMFDDNKERREQTKKNRGFDPFAQNFARHTWKRAGKSSTQHGRAVSTSLST